MTQRGWTGADAQALRVQAGLSIEEFAAELSVAPRTVAYWAARPTSVPRGAIQDLLDDFQTTRQQRSAAPAENHTGDAVLEATELLVFDTGRILPSVGAEGIDLLSAQVRTIARTYTTRPLMDEFRAAAGLQRQASSLLDRTARPNELIDIYVLIAQSGALMASCAFDLGRAVEALQCSRAALMFADRAGDQSLASWILGLQASLDLWADRPLQALDTVTRGLARAPRGQPRYRLLHIGARAAAAAGDRSRTADLQREADRCRLDQTTDYLADDIGGEFHFDQGRAAACAAAAWLALGDGQQVMECTQQAIANYAVQEGGGVRVPMLGARLDLTNALVQIGDIDAAEEQLEAAFSDAAEHRYSLVARVEQVATQLDRRRSERHSNDLLDATRQWLTETAGRV